MPAKPTVDTMARTHRRLVMMGLLSVLIGSSIVGKARGAKPEQAARAGRKAGFRRVFVPFRNSLRGLRLSALLLGNDCQLGEFGRRHPDPLEAFRHNAVR